MPPLTARQPGLPQIVTDISSIRHNFGFPDSMATADHKTWRFFTPLNIFTQWICGKAIVKKASA